MKTPTKRATRRLAASLAITVTATAMLTANAANLSWTGKTNDYYNEAGNWSDPLALPGSSDIIIIEDSNFNDRFTAGAFEIVFNNAYSAVTRTVVRKVGTADKPLVFRATAANNGLTFGRNTDSNASLGIGNQYGNGDSYMRIENGTWASGSKELQVGSANYAGYLTLKDINSFTATFINVVNGSLTLDGGSVKTTGNYTRIGASGGNGILTVKAGSSFDNLGQTTNPNMTLGQDSGSSGTLNVEGGSFTITGYVALNYNGSAKSSTVNVTDGGVLTVGRMFLNNKGTSGGTIALDGGTLKAYANDTPSAFFIPAHANLTVTVGAGGGTIDNGGHNITIGEDLGGTGVMTFKGGGKTTLNGDGQTNRYEFVVGSDPNVVNMPFAVDQVTASSVDTISLAWKGVAGRVYQVKRASTPNGTYENYGGKIMPDADGDCAVEIPTTEAAAAFFKIEVSLQ